MLKNEGEILSGGEFVVKATLLGGDIAWGDLISGLKCGGEFVRKRDRLGEFAGRQVCLRRVCQGLSLSGASLSGARLLGGELPCNLFTYTTAEFADLLSHTTKTRLRNTSCIAILSQCASLSKVTLNQPFSRADMHLIVSVVLILLLIA